MEATDGTTAHQSRVSASRRIEVGYKRTLKGAAHLVIQPRLDVERLQQPSNRHRQSLLRKVLSATRSPTPSEPVMA
jgi:hypothetical protein